MDFTDAMMSDSLTNVVTGLGTLRDKTTSGSFTWRPMLKQELDAAYQCDWLAGSIVDIPADDMTRKWRSWKGSATQIKQMQATEKRLRVRERVNKALKVARLYGGSAILIGDGSPNPSKELLPETVSRGGIKYLHVLSRFEISAGDVERDPLSPYFGEPKAYFLGAGNDGKPPTAIHPSRVVRFQGHERAESMGGEGWGFSVLQRCYDAIRNVASTSANLAIMAYEAKLDVVAIPNLTKNANNPEYRSRLLERFRLASLTKSVNGTLLLDAEEIFTQRQLSLSGLPDALRMFLEIAAGAADIPTTRLLGTSPKGMNATGESDTRNYYDMLSAQQITKLEPGLDRLDELMIRDATGSRPKAIHYLWEALWQMRENETSAVNLQKAQMAEIYAALGAMPKDALATAIQGMLLEDGTFPGLEAALEEAKAKKQPNEPLANKMQITGNQVAAAPPKNAPPNASA